MIEYNKKRIAEFLEREQIPINALARAFGIKDFGTTDKIVKGNDVKISKIIKFCNYYGVNPLEFFVNDNGEPLSTLVDNTELIEACQFKPEYARTVSQFKKMQAEERSKELNSDPMFIRMDIPLEKMSDENSGEDYQKKYFDATIEIKLMKEQHAKELLEMKIKLIEEYYEKLETQRTNEFSIYKVEVKERQDIIDAKNDEILKLKEEILMTRNNTQAKPYIAKTTNPMDVAADRQHEYPKK